MYANPNLINKTQPRKTFLCSRKVKILIRNMLKICLCFHFPLFARIPNTTPQLEEKTKPANLKLRAAGKQKPRSWYKVNMRRANKHIQHSAIPATCKHVELLRVMGLLHFSGVPPHFYTTLFYSILNIFVTFQCTVGDDVQPGQMAISGQKPSWAHLLVAYAPPYTAK